MKKYSYGLAVLGVLVGLLAGVANAQEEIQDNTRANIPFAFYAGTDRLPAGVYTFEIDPISHDVMIGQDATGHSILMAGMPADGEQDGKPLLTFEDVNGLYRLKEVQFDEIGVEFTPAHISQGALSVQ